MNEFDLIVFSHLRWHFVYQRPQHLLSRLAQWGHRVLFIEEPVEERDTQTPSWELTEPQPNVMVATPHTNATSGGFSDEQIALMQPMLAEIIARANVNAYVLWFYTPLALPLVQSLAPRAVVYDCMDELSMFLGAPRELIARERELLQQADVVFTGGPSLYRAKQSKHPNLHCFPSSVDASHFRQAMQLDEAADLRALPPPRLGFFGVVDERMDVHLLDAMAQAHPDWQIVIVGPVVKIAPDDLPQHPNLHYLGARRYDELPSYLAGWDVCLLPFARNDSTQFISPTKTLEYMAAEIMIVSTPITDVAEPYGEIVFLGSTPAEFIAACERALNIDERERARRVAKMRAVLSRTSWDRTAQQMEQLIGDALANHQALGTFMRTEALSN